MLISGNGSNLQALIDSTQAGLLAAQIVHVVSNRRDAYGLTRARAAGVPATYHGLAPYKARHPGGGSVPEARAAYDADLATLVLAQRPQLIVCAGWMHILSLAFLDPIAAANVDIINLHPALPGQFDGANAIQRAYAAFKKGEIKHTGIMIHRVITEVDKGQPLLVREVEIKEEDTLQDLEDRIHQVEHIAIVEGARIALEQRAKNIGDP